MIASGMGGGWLGQEQAHPGNMELGELMKACIELWFLVLPTGGVLASGWSSKKLSGRVQKSMGAVVWFKG